jgi:hypothetical protein
MFSLRPAANIMNRPGSKDRCGAFLQCSDLLSTAV